MGGELTDLPVKQDGCDGKREQPVSIPAGWAETHWFIRDFASTADRSGFQILLQHQSRGGFHRGPDLVAGAIQRYPAGAEKNWTA